MPIVGDPQEPPDVPQIAETPEQHALADVYADAIEFARQQNQIADMGSDYYITLKQLEQLMLKYRQEK